MLERLVRSLHSRNPFYLLSAVCMLTGCYALSRAIGLQPGNWKPLVELIGVLQIYEFVLLGLAMFLSKQDRMPGDARMAFLLGLLFIADATFLNTELAASSPWIAPWMALAHLAFLVPKWLFLRDALALTSLRVLALTPAQIGLLVYIPGTFSAIHFMDSRVHALGLGRAMLPLVIYVVWWLVGMLPLAYLWADGDSEHGHDRLARSISRASLYVPSVSILVHLFMLHWLYGLPVYASYLTPLYLGVATNVVYTLAKSSTPTRRLLQWGAPLVAVFLSSSYPDSLVFVVGGAFVVTPLRLALLGIAATLLIHRFLSSQPAFGWASILAVALMFSGHSFDVMRMRLRRVVPDTVGEFGVAALVAAFALLALAVAVSLWRPRDEPPPATPDRRIVRYAE